MNPLPPPQCGKQGPERINGQAPERPGLVGTRKKNMRQIPNQKHHGNGQNKGLSLEREKVPLHPFNTLPRPGAPPPGAFLSKSVISRSVPRSGPYFRNALPLMGRDQPGRKGRVVAAT